MTTPYIPSSQKIQHFVNDTFSNYSDYFLQKTTNVNQELIDCIIKVTVYRILINRVGIETITEGMALNEIFINLTIKEGFFSKNFDFGDKTAIYSHINSVGKSTLLRLLFYSIGYSIPSTKKIRFDKLETILYLETVEGICEIYRKDKDIVLKCIDSETWKLRLPKDLEFILQKIFNIRNSDVLLNIIGAIYLDQDKGWTLLNRGTVIGGIKFKIDQLIQGMLNIEPLQALNVELEEVVEGISRLKQLKKIVDYQHENTTIIKESNFESTKLLDLEKNLSMIMGKISSLESEKDTLRVTLEKNEEYLAYLENLHLFIKAPESGEEFLLKKEFVKGFGAYQKIIELKIYNLERKIKELRKKKRGKNKDRD